MRTNLRRPADALRAALALHTPLVAPGCHDAFGARLVEEAGFAAAYMSGNASSASRIGCPDIGLLTQTEMVANAHGIAHAVGIPLISDADTGYGDAYAIQRTVEEFAAAGVAAIQIEDQLMPKRCGAMPGVAIAGFDEAVGRIVTAVAAREFNDLLVIARTDALATGDYAEAIRRARAFAGAGADLVIVEDCRNAEDVERIAEDLAGLPLMFDAFEAWPWSLRAASELGAMGYRLVIFPLSLTLAFGVAARKVLHALRVDGTTRGVLDDLMDRHDYEKLLGLTTEAPVAPAPR
jgi:2-methylisocitrate lyase-like PEP mutase family enzyme